MDDSLFKNGDAALKTVDARMLTDTQTHTQTHRQTDTQTDRHDRFYDSCPSLMGNYNNINGVSISHAFREKATIAF